MRSWQPSRYYRLNTCWVDSYSNAVNRVVRRPSKNSVKPQIRRPSRKSAAHRSRATSHSLAPTTSPHPTHHHHNNNNGHPPTQVPPPPPQTLRKPSNTPHRFNQKVLLDTTPLPASIPPVPEIGASSAPLLSASFFIGARCKTFNDDYMVCKTEAHGKGELECMREGRKVTRCAASV